MADFTTDAGAFQDLPIFGNQIQEFNGDYSAGPSVLSVASAVPIEDISSESYSTGEFDFTFDAE